MMNNQMILYGLTEAEENELRKVNPNKKSTIFVTDCATDIIAIGAYAVILRKSALDQADYEMLCSYIKEVGDYTDPVILIGEDDKLPKYSKQVKVYQTFEVFLSKAKFIFIAAYSKCKQSDAFSTKLSLALRILMQIKRRPGISTATLADEFEVSSRTVQRYIETLRMSGEWIDYDVSLHGWRLEHEKSFLLDFENCT